MRQFITEGLRNIFRRKGFLRKKILVNHMVKTHGTQNLCKKELDTNQDTCCIKIGVQLWSE